MKLKECPLKSLCKYYNDKDYACIKQHKSCIYLPKNKK